MITDTTGLPQPPVEPSEWLLHEAHERVVSLIQSLKESGGISVNHAYDAPQDARLAHQHGEYDILYNMLLHLGPHDPYVIEGAVRGMRENGVENTSPALSARQMDAAKSIRKVIVDRHRARIETRPDDESPYYAYAMNRLSELPEIIEIMERGFREPSEIEPLLEQKRTVGKSVSGGAL